MTLRERFLAWWYVPTIEARQAEMLREVRRRRGGFRITSFRYSGGPIVVNASGGNGPRNGPHDGKTHQIDFTKGKFIW